MLRLIVVLLTIFIAVFAALILHSLPESYSTIVQTLITQAGTNAITLADVRNAMYAEEERRNGGGSSTAVNAVTAKKTDKDKCRYCKKSGHWEKDCRKKKRDKERKKGGGSNSNNSSSSSTPSVNAVTSESASMDMFAAYVSPDTIWMLDSGCTHHVTNSLSDFESYTPYSSPHTVSLGGARSIPSLGSGTVKGVLGSGKSAVSMDLSNVIYVPNIGFCLMSISVLDAKGFTITYRNSKCEISRGNKVMATGTL